MAKKPNIILILTDQERFPPPHETREIKDFLAGLPGHSLLRKHGVEFENHYTASCACTPSRACLYTGQYPSLHGVTQTYGGAKSADDPRLVWLEPQTVPTMGNYFQAAGYDTKYVGKWHISHEDLVDEKGFVTPSVEKGGKKNADVIEAYRQANLLEKFGFSGWIGPEPHGAGRANAGWNRDGDFAEQAVEFLEEREKLGPDASPFLMAVNLVNPHDIVFFPFWLTYGYPTTDGTVPDVPPPPTEAEDLSTKPSTQLSYHKQYNKLFFPHMFQEQYRQLYYFLHKVVDKEILKIYQKLASSSFYDNTYVFFTSDHGDLLGAHGGLRQKWYNAYQESLHVPFIISHPRLRPGAVDRLTSSVDLIPTMLGLAGLDPSKLASTLTETHTEVHPLVGTDLAGMVTSGFLQPFAPPPQPPQGAGLALVEPPVFCQIEDHVTEGDAPVFTGAKSARALLQVHHFEFDPVLGPTALEVVLCRIRSPSSQAAQLWKFVRYWDNPQNWSVPYVRHDFVLREGGIRRGQVVRRTTPLPDEFELYNLSEDPLETRNLAYYLLSSPSPSPSSTPSSSPSSSSSSAASAASSAPPSGFDREGSLKVLEFMRARLEEERARKATRPFRPRVRREPHKLPDYVTQNQQKATLAQTIAKLFAFPDPPKGARRGYSKL